MQPLNIKEFPQDFFIEIENNDHLLGRITVNQFKTRFNTEISIIMRESKKIYSHVDSLYDLEDPKEAIDQSVLRLSEYLRSLSK